MMGELSKQVDICVFGVSSATGSSVCEEIAELIQMRHSFTMAFADADRERIAAVKQRLLHCPRFCQATKDIIRAAPSFVCDILSPASILDVCAKTKVIVNCMDDTRSCRFSVIEGCLKARTHYLDNSSESEYIQEAIKVFDKQAFANKVSVILGCGFDSIPTDVGCVFSRNYARKHRILPTAVESYLTLQTGKINFIRSYVDWALAVETSDTKGLLQIIRDVFSPMYAHRSKNNDILAEKGYGYFKPLAGPFAWSRLMSRWCMPIPDPSITFPHPTQLFEMIEHHNCEYNTQLGRSRNHVIDYDDVDFLGYPRRKSTTKSQKSDIPVVWSHYVSYITVPSKVWCTLLPICVKIRIWLNRYFSYTSKTSSVSPQFISKCHCSEEVSAGDKKNCARSSLRFRTWGYHGASAQSRILKWPYINISFGESSSLSAWHPTLPNALVITEVSTQEPEHIMTPRCLMTCALLASRRSAKAGVLTPSTAFDVDELVPLLQDRGVRFELLTMKKGYDQIEAMKIGEEKNLLIDDDNSPYARPLETLVRNVADFVLDWIS